VEKDAYLLELTTYLVLNPVRAGLVATSEQWPWSSYMATAGLARAEEFLHTHWILGSFAPSKALAQQRYISFVLEGEGKESPLKAAKGGLILGGRDFIQELRDFLDERLCTDPYARWCGRENVVRPFPILIFHV